MNADLHSLVAPYALDALDEAEEQTFEEHLALCERCRKELASLRQAAAGLAYGAPPVTPPPELKERILTQARSERPNVIPLRRRRWTGALAAAATIAAAAAVVLGIWAASLSGSKDPLESVLSKPGARLVSMGPAGAVAVAPDGKAVLEISVGRAPAGKTFQAWVIQAGTAKPAGLFPGRAGTSVVELTRHVPRGAVIAVTRERAGGAPQPTSKPLAQSGPVS